MKKKTFASVLLAMEYDAPETATCRACGGRVHVSDFIGGMCGGCRDMADQAEEGR